MFNLFRNQQGEIATALTIVAVAVMALGSLLGGLLASRQQPQPLRSQAEEVQPTLDNRCIAYKQDGSVLESKEYDPFTAGYIKYYDVAQGGTIRQWDDYCIGSGTPVRLRKYES